MIEIDGLTKRYGDKTAVDGLSFVVEPGVVTGFLGPNRAGCWPADNGYLDSTVFIVTFDEWGGFYDHVPPPRVIDDTNPADVMHAGDSTTPTDGQLIPDYRQLGFRVPGLVISNLAVPRRVVREGPFEHCSSLALIESTFGLRPLTARDRHARNLRDVPGPVNHPPRPQTFGGLAGLTGTSGMADLFKSYRSKDLFFYRTDR